MPTVNSCCILTSDKKIKTKELKIMYISDEVKAKLDKAARIDKRSLVDEIDFLVSERLSNLENPQQQDQISA